MHAGLLLGLAAPAVVSAQLHDLAQAAGLDFFGAAIGEGNTYDSEYMAIASDTSEIGQLTPENGQKWDATEPNRGQFNFQQGDIVADIAAQNGQLLRCHTLTWYSQLPGWGESGTDI